MKGIPVRKITTSHPEQEQGRFSIRDVGTLLAGETRTWHLHRHDFYFILAIQKGNGLHEIDFKTCKITPNSIFCLRPGQVHRLELHKGTKGFLIEFDRQFYAPKEKSAARRLKRAVTKNLCKTPAFASKDIFNLIAAMLSEFVGRKSNYREVIRAYLDIFFIELLRHAKEGNATEAQTTAYDQQRFDEFVELVESNLNNTKNVSAYADMMNLSPYQLNAITKAAVGQPASQLIGELVLLEAKRLLLATTHQVKDIAYHLGFEDVSYFIRFFKKHCGQTPELFRSNSR